jgi:LysM repeat protein
MSKLISVSRIVLVILLLATTILVQAEDTSGGTHTVQAGENLFRIALRYGVEMGQLASANNISDPRRIFVGQVLIIPGLSIPDASESIENPLVATSPVTHTVQRGEYLSSIAQRYGVTVADILSANNITDPNRIFAGQVLQIWSDDVSVEITEPVAAAPVETSAPEPAPAATTSTTHTVRPGEYLSLIARNYGVSWTTIAEANGITDPNRVFAGMQLTIPGSDGTQVAYTAPAQASGEIGAHWGRGRELVVDLSTQMAYAFDDGVMMRSALVSTGLPATPTVQGEYAIWHKTPAQTMSGPGYYLPNVQWVMYFYQGYGFHGTYWHNNFGNPMSHGCVNMTNDDAYWFYNFADYGTPVWVQW